MSAYTQAQLDALRAAAARGTSKVTYGDGSVEYMPLPQILKMIRIIERELSTAARPTHWNPEFARQG